VKQPSNHTFSGTERFLIRRQLGAGGMGAVYEAFDRERDELVALKTVLRLDGSTLYRFKHEFRSLTSLSHPGLVRLYELFSEGNQWFFTMELVEGVSFLEYVCPDPDSLREDRLEETDLAGGETTVKDNAVASLPAGAPSGMESTGSGESTVRASSSAQVNDGLEISLDQTLSVVTQPLKQPSTEVDPARVVPARLELAAQVSTVEGSRPEGSMPATTSDRPNVTISASRPSVHRPDFARLRSGLRQLAEVLNEMHARGKLHRDIKPSNVLVTRAGRVVLLDFGLSTELEARAEPDTTDGHIVGTVTYMAPEQAGGSSVTPASDWYSVGVMLYRTLTGRLPHSGKVIEVLIEKQRTDPPRPREAYEDIPEDLDQLCMELLRRDPADRPSGDDILRRLGGSAVVASRLGSERRLFVGRESQLAALRTAFADLCKGKTVSIFVHGRSGAGKSSLIERFLEGVRERSEAVILAGRCYEQESVAYKAVDTLIDALTRYLRRLARTEADALMPRDVATLAQVFPVLRRVESVAEAPRRLYAIPDQLELRRRAFASLRELLTRIGDRRPLVLAIDDLQWGDLDSAQLLSELLRPPDPPVLLLAGSYRSEYATVSPFLRVLLQPQSDGTLPREIALEPLTPAEARELALRLIGLDDAPAVMLAETIVRESRGSPYFVYELVEYLKEGGDIAEGSTHSSDISLDTVLGRRIAKLTDSAGQLLEVVSLAGQPLRQSVACKAAGQGAAGYAGLTELRTQHLIRGTGLGSNDEVETYHDRIRETVVNMMADDRRRELHGGLARELEAAGGADAETLAVHFEGAGELASAGRYYSLAADEASEALAFDRAVKLYRYSLDLRPAGLDDERRILSRLGDALANVGRSVEAANAYQKAAAHADQLEQTELQRRAAYQFLASGHIDEGLAAYGAILDPMGLSLPETPRRALLRLYVSRARLALRGLKFTERAASEVAAEKLELVDIFRSLALGISIVDVIRGADYQTRSLLHALDAGEPLRVALALGWEAIHLGCLGRPGWRRTEHLVNVATKLANRIGHPHALGTASLAAGSAEFLIGRYQSGLEFFNQAEAIFRDRCTGVIWELDTTRIYILWTLFYLGRLADLRDRCQEVFQEASERGDRYMVATPGPFVGAFARLGDDDVEGARRFARDALGQWSHQGFHIQHLNFYYGNLYIDLYAGDAAGAWRRIKETERVLESSLLLRIQQVNTDVIQHAGRCAVAMAAVDDDPEPLLRQAEKSARRLDQQQTDWAFALARLVRAGVASLRRDDVHAAKHLADSIERFELADMGLFAASARRQLGQLRGGDEGRELIEQADALMRLHSIRNPSRMASCLAPGFAPP
jgi:tetratricopeptide (TPR) repeat protein